jgi:hypothetical protein
MTNEQINITIAGALGKAVEWHDGIPYWLGMWSSVGEGNESFAEFKPAYDLNAMHESEKILTTKQKQRYAIALSDDLSDSAPTESCHTVWSDTIHATARQRAEAFLKTIGKWEEQ